MQNEKSLKYATFKKDQFSKYFKDVKVQDYTDVSVKRQLMLLKDMGTSILDDADLTELNSVKAKMATIYNAAKICPFNKQNCDLNVDGMTLDPDIELTLASSSNFEEQKYVWEQWHEKSGKLMRTDYKTYISLMNKAAKENSKKVKKIQIHFHYISFCRF